MSEEKEASGGSGLKNAIIGLITIIVTAIAGVIGKKVLGGDEAPAAAVSAPAPNIVINNTQAGGGTGGKSDEKKEEKKDGWTKKEPKW
jgi:hypothetical protein